MYAYIRYTRTSYGTLLEAMLLQGLPLTEYTKTRLQQLLPLSFLCLMQLHALCASLCILLAYYYLNLFNMRYSVRTLHCMYCTILQFVCCSQVTVLKNKSSLHYCTLDT